MSSRIARRKSAAPPSRIAAHSWSRASRSCAKRASIRWPRPAFLSAVGKAMKRFDAAKQDGFSAQSRLRDMDEQGVDIQIMYPTVAGQMLGREFRDIKLLAACMRAYNDWACDYRFGGSGAAELGRRLCRCRAWKKR